MKLAYNEAERAFEVNEVPVGAIIVKNNKVIASAHNLVETDKDPTAHAEIIALKKAANILGNWRLNDCSIYVTLEPCPMCTGALIQSRISKIFFGTYDMNDGCCGSYINLTKILKKDIKIYGGIMEDKCQDILNRFFSKKRAEG